MSIFFDTNVLVYAVTSDPRAAIARDCLAEGGQTSIQVLNELTNVLLRKSKFRWIEIEGILQSFEIRFPDPQPLAKTTHVIALGLIRAHSIAVYDALIIAAALEAGCTRLYTEELQPGRKFGDLTIFNPFKSN